MPPIPSEIIGDGRVGRILHQDIAEFPRLHVIVVNHDVGEKAGVGDLFDYLKRVGRAARAQ